MASLQRRHLPLEVCELVMDFMLAKFINGSWWMQSYLPLTFIEQGHRELKQLTCICSAWLPRARIVLYHAVPLRTPAHVDLFIRSITQNSSLAQMVRVLAVVPNSDSIYIPFVHHALVGRLRRVTTFVLCLRSQTKWELPPRHHSLVAMYPIRELALSCPGSTHMVLNAFRLIWSLHQLQKLRLETGTSTEEVVVEPSDARRLTAIRRPWSCAELKTLRLECSDYSLLPEGAFGTSLTHLHIRFERKSISLSKCGSLLSLLSSLSSLEEVQFDIHGIPPGRPGENDCVVAGDIVPVLTHLPAQDALHTITFRLWVIQNRRRQFLRELFRREVDGLLAKFPNLTSLAFQLPECSGSRYDRERWEGLLSDHLPRLRRTVIITVTIYWDEMFYPSTYWVDEAEEDIYDWRNSGESTQAEE